MDLRTGRVTDFDFLIGDWTISNRRLKQRWVGSDDWDTFSSVATCEYRLGGVGNVEQIDCPDRGFSGMSVRLFDLAASRWSIYWASSDVGRLEPPVRGGFEGNVGVFEGLDSGEGSPMFVRFTWTVADAHHRWQQAFTRDERHWETNWIMDFTRGG